MSGSNPASFAMLLVLALLSGCGQGSTRAIDSVLLVEAGRAMEVWSVYQAVAEERSIAPELAESAGQLMARAKCIHVDLADTGPHAHLSTEGKRQLVAELAAEREQVMAELLRAAGAS